MIVGALILAGGRSTRLGSSAKQKLLVDGVPLLARTVRAVRRAGARDVVVVGDESVDDARTVREEPPFGGPVAAVAAGLAALPADTDLVLVLACDMPAIDVALPALLAAPEGDGTIAVDRGRRQHLALAARPAALAGALAALPALPGAAMRELLAPLDLREAPVPDGATDDIDTWGDAARFGAVPPTPTGARP